MKNKKNCIISIILTFSIIMLTGCTSYKQNKSMLKDIANKYLPEVKADGYLSNVIKSEIRQDIIDKGVDGIDESDISDVKFCHVFDYLYWFNIIWNFKCNSFQYMW